ncbi:MAG: hypothetical protein QXU18_11180, partial [Thermoplasmatales archaeon]
TYVYLNGSFNAPNQGNGSYWIVSYEWTQNYLSSSSASGLSFIAYSGTSGTMVPPTYLKLYEGNGALLTGISSSGLATIEAAINSTVSTSLTVPISQLNAAITSINGATAKLKTTIGNLSVELSTINATVASIQNGMVLVKTDLGSIITSLASLNASIVAFNKNIVTINTTLGNIQTSITSIGTSVSLNGNGIATIKTDLGNLTGNVTSVSNGIATIQTKLGTLQSNVSAIQSNTVKTASQFSTNEIFLIVILVLVLITLVISFLAVNSANKIARKVEEQKKQ